LKVKIVHSSLKLCDNIFVFDEKKINAMAAAATSAVMISDVNETWRASRGSIDDDIESMIMDPLSLADISRQG
jgi:hypothetical protein